MIGGWRWTARARRRHYFYDDHDGVAFSLCNEWSAHLNGMEQADPGPDDCQICSRKLKQLTKGDRTLLP